MSKADWEQQRREALSRHWQEEVEMFGLRPWEMPPCLADRDEPPGQPAWRETFARAKQLRAQLLERDPNHYADLDPPKGKR